MSRSDHRGQFVTGASDKALDRFEDALVVVQRYVGDPFAPLDEALADSPDFAMAHALKAYLFLCGSEAAGVGRAQEIIPALRKTAKTDREKLHLVAIESYATGDFEGATERLEDILIAHPRDVVALQQAHLLDFYRGDARNLRDRVARVRHAWSGTLPGYHAVLAMHAFGLEECGDYARAEEIGRAAIDLEPRDTWAQHAVAHVMEMQGRRADGIRWMRERERYWSPDSFFAVHNWWHLALYHLDLDSVTEALDIYDTQIWRGASGVALDMVDASAMLWRMHLRGIDLAGRWSAVAEAWAPTACDGWYAFNDVHAMMAFVGAGRWDLADRQLLTLRRRVERNGTNQMMTRDVGLPLARALYAFGRGDYSTAVSLLRPLRSIANRFGGSHAQRDLIDQTLIAAADRAGQSLLADALRRERAERIQ